ncbi:hypothetical protein MOB78_12500 [Bacillus spizizenii]|nr:hypothetical protein [Bacillus spizizenii]
MTSLSAKPNTADNPGKQTEERKISREEEWAQVEELVMKYKEQFNDDATERQVQESQDAAGELLNRFYPLFKKYLILLRSGQIDFNDKEMKLFVSSFMDEEALKSALKRKKQKAEYRAKIYQKFNFIKETYGFVPEDEIMVDLQSIFLEMARRYKQMGKSFCGYLYNSFRYEVSRHIKRFTKNPINIPYRHTQFEDYMRYCEEPSIENDFEDKFYENSIGIPDMTWISGENCSDLFAVLTPIERKLIIKYYLEEWNDRQISEEFGIHINTVNQKRRQAVGKLAAALNIDESDIKRNRKSGKRAIIPLRT